MVVCCLYYITTIIVKICECTPRARIWNKSIEGTCISIARVLNTDGVFNTLSDVFILLVPLKALWKLKMKTRRKIGIGMLFTVGLMLVFPTLSLPLTLLGFLTGNECQTLADKNKSTDLQYHWLGYAIARKLQS